MTASMADSYLVQAREYVQWQAALIRELRAELTTQQNTVKLLESKIEEMGRDVSRGGNEKMA